MKNLNDLVTDIEAIVTQSRNRAELNSKVSNLLTEATSEKIIHDFCICNRGENKIDVALQPTRNLDFIYFPFTLS